MNLRRRNILIAAVVVLLLLLGIIFVDPHDNPNPLHTDNPNLPASVAALPEVFVKPEPAKVKALVGRKEDFKFELELDSKSILPSESLFGTAFLTNNSENDISIWSLLPQDAKLRINVVNAKNILILDKFYANIYSWSTNRQEFILTKHKREPIRFCLTAVFNEPKLNPGTYKVNVHYESPELPKLSSNEVTLVVREK